MTQFKNPESAWLARERLQDLTGIDIESFMNSTFQGNVSPDTALTNLERWLRATANPTLYMEQVVGMAKAGKMLVSMFGASQPIANTLIQNPELANVVLDRSELRRLPRPDQIRVEGHQLLAAATSYLHGLDRLRYLRQRWNLPISVNDLCGNWDQEAVWLALSDLADILIELTFETAWSEFAKQKQLSERPQLMIVAFGKLGGRELNYSSDVDLVYVAEDGLDERLDRDLTRFFEAFGRALMDRMGRGSLYRVDLRLRPYGAAGPILRSMRSFEAYYRLYAEPWEVQALLRSRPIVGSESLIFRWQAMRKSHCFRPNLSEISLEGMLSMKARIEEGASDSDIKRGEGGIRDVEFLTQILQMIHGHDRPDLQAPQTCEALRALEVAGILEHSVAQELIGGYTFLRRLEHRTQLVGDQQTHTIPTGDEAREGLAKMMALDSWHALSQILGEHRRKIQNLYRSTLNLESATSGDRSRALHELGALGPAAINWFDSLPESSAFYRGLMHNEGSLDRVRRILTHAPRLVTHFRSSVSLTELLMSGEIEEQDRPNERLKRLLMSTEPSQLAEIFSHAYTVLLARWVLAPDFALGPEIANLFDALIEHCVARMHLEFDILGLGSYGTRDLGPGSDADLVLLLSDRTKHSSSELQAERFLAFLGQLRRLGAPIQVDLRLRPEGSKGLLVRTLEGFKTYDLDDMEVWERFALGHARLVSGSQTTFDVVMHSAYNHPLTTDGLEELKLMKHRVETERVKPQHAGRQVKLGSGGLNDIEWLVHLFEMRFPVESKAGRTSDIETRVKNLVDASLLGGLDGKRLSQAHQYLLDLRYRIYLLGIDDDLMPENPDKLERLAASCGFVDGNSLLARHQSTVESVRRMYLEGLNRLTP